MLMIFHICLGEMTTSSDRWLVNTIIILLLNLEGNLDIFSGSQESDSCKACTIMLFNIVPPPLCLSFDYNEQ